MAGRPGPGDDGRATSGTFPRGENPAAWARLSRQEREDLFVAVSTRERAELLEHVDEAERRRWVRLLPPDELADLARQSDARRRDDVLRLLDEPSRFEVRALLAYAEDEAGGLMEPALHPATTGDDGR